MYIYTALSMWQVLCYDNLIFHCTLLALFIILLLIYCSGIVSIFGVLSYVSTWSGLFLLSFVQLVGSVSAVLCVWKKLVLGT